MNELIVFLTTERISAVGRIYAFVFSCRCFDSIFLVLLPLPVNRGGFTTPQLFVF
jgi:hypothetical protein